MSRLLSPYEKNQLIKHGPSVNLPATNHSPVEYLTGHVDFAGYDFLVNRHVLIPRIETQEIIDLALPYLKSKTRLPTGMVYDLKSPNIADIGTGSGALGLSLSLRLIASHLPHRLFLSDVSAKTLSLAAKNAHRLLPTNHQPALIRSNLLSNFPPLKFDLILANLPYLPSTRLPRLDPSVRAFEPHLALDGGPDGTTIINRLLGQLPRFTHPGALAILEIDHTHTLSHFRPPAYLSAAILPDSLGYPRFLVLKSNSSPLITP